MKIFLMEDNGACITTITNELKDKGHDVFHRSTGDHALKHVKDFGPDLVIADYQMPKVDGLTACANIRQEFKELPLILFSGWMFNKEEAKTIREIKFETIIAKDFMRLFEYVDMMNGVPHEQY
jgi:CheY-like chemotaxis protein